jgi:uncharacterized membrane protein
MTRSRIAGLPAAELLAYGAALSFVILGMALFRHPETAVLRLAVWGWPAWPVKVLAVAEILAGLMLLSRTTRMAAAWLLIAVSAGQLAAHAAYAEGESVLRAMCQLLVLAGVLLLSRKP